MANFKWLHFISTVVWYCSLLLLLLLFRSTIILLPHYDEKTCRSKKFMCAIINNLTFSHLYQKLYEMHLKVCNKNNKKNRRADGYMCTIVDVCSRQLERSSFRKSYERTSFFSISLLFNFRLNFIFEQSPTNLKETLSNKYSIASRSV